LFKRGFPTKKYSSQHAQATFSGAKISPNNQLDPGLEDGNEIQEFVPGALNFSPFGHTTAPKPARCRFP
jgi:hypothetical protein